MLRKQYQILLITEEREEMIDFIRVLLQNKQNCESLGSWIETQTVNLP